jgi:hypothetical protein
MTAKMEVYFRIYEEPSSEEEKEHGLQYPQLAIHYPAYKVQKEQPLWEYKTQTGTVTWKDATLDLSEVKVRRDKECIEISPKMNIAKRYARIILDKETARKLAYDILEELSK